MNFFQWLKGRGLDGVKLIVGDKCLGMLEAVGVPSRVMRKFVCRLWLNEVSRQ